MFVNIFGQDDVPPQEQLAMQRTCKAWRACVMQMGMYMIESWCGQFGTEEALEVLGDVDDMPFGCDCCGKIEG